MSDPLLEAIAVGFDTETGTLFDDVDLAVLPGEFLAVSGAAGSGKSVFAAILAGVLAPKRGSVRFDRRPMPPVGQRGRRPAFAPQDGALVPELTAAESVALPLQLWGVEGAEIGRRVDFWLDALGLSACTDRAVADLSGGQRQRVSIARTLAGQSDALIFDEPTAEIDAANRALVLSLMLSARDNGAAVVAITHDEDVLEKASRVFELRAPAEIGALS